MMTLYDVVIILVWTIVGFCLGSIPFSVWMGRSLLHTDVRRFGDGNPGAANLMRAGGWPIGLLAGVLDYSKGLAPVGIAHFSFQITGWGLVPIALAPVLGHAFSPFLKFHGGKALATSFGIWTGLTLGEGPILLGAFLAIFFLLLASDSWSVILGFIGWTLHLLVRGASVELVAIALGNLLILIWKHRRDLRRGLRIRPFLQRLLRKAKSHQDHGI
jgi:glycerol-3-phosphate acyltransferase PlsY